ncbi:MAG: PKD domain-containing protein [Bacteroidales bacterium]|nr:PKD domain-containing protein [Bacteroidales bacterium]
MKKVCIILLFIIPVFVIGQQNFRIVRLPFNTSGNEMAPVIYKNGIVFSSDSKSSVVRVATDINNNYPYNLYFVEKKGRKWGKPEPFAPEISSALSEATASFSSDFKIMYITRNLRAGEKLSELQKVSDTIKFGVYQATEAKKEWILSREFPYNDEGYDLVHPALSPDGKLLFFASTMSGGYGGYDIYQSVFENGQWQSPKNLGPVINTFENEVFPFLHQNGRLYFSSRGHNSQGGLDIFYSEIINGEWIAPVNLPRPFNSRRDDFGYVISANLDTGYFASNRLTGADDDIYMFASSFPNFKDCKPQIDETFCYEFNETGTMDIDTTALKYEWDFGDGNKQRTVIAEHCYKGPGAYAVALNVIDTLTGDIYYSEASYELIVEPREQPYISCPDTVVVDEKVDFGSERSVIRSFAPNNYYWDFGDGNITTGRNVQHTFTKTGTFYVRLGITAVEDDPEAKVVDLSNRACSMKQVVVVKNLVNKN